MIDMNMNATANATIKKRKKTNSKEIIETYTYDSKNNEWKCIHKITYEV